MFKALADPSRRELLDRLRADNGQTLGQLAANLDMTRQAVTKHLAVLEEANLVAVVWRGREKLHYLNPVPIHEIALDLHLPPVFDYAWVDGSLSPAESGGAVDWSYDLPEPGKRLSFRQLLVTRSAPRLTLDYDVDLAGAYFVP